MSYNYHKKIKGYSYATHTKRGVSSQVANSVISGSLHSGGLGEMYEQTPILMVVRRCIARRNKDKDRYGNSTRGFHEYMRDEGFGAKKYILSRPAQTAIARAASGENVQDRARGINKPYSYYIKKHQGFI